MNYAIFVWEMVNFVLISLFSSIIYMYFEYQDSNVIYKLFIPKNDSIWERIKVLLAPTLLMMLIEVLLVSMTPNFIFAKFASIITMVIANPIIFVLYFKFSKWDMLVNNVLTTITSALVGLIMSMLILNMPDLTNGIIYISIIGIIMIMGFFVVATFCQGDEFIFVDPITKKTKLKKDH